MGVGREMDSCAEFLDLCYGFEDLDQVSVVSSNGNGEGRTVTSACSRSAAPHARPQIPAPTMMILSFSSGVGMAIVVFGVVQESRRRCRGELITSGCARSVGVAFNASMHCYLTQTRRLGG